MNQEKIRSLLIDNARIYVQVADAEDGVPEMAIGDTFIYAIGSDGSPKKMPFMTIITKDYPGFDEDSNLNIDRGFRVNIELGKEKFAEVFGFSPKDFSKNRDSFDFTTRDSFFPHPVYGAHGWLCVVNPADNTDSELVSLVEFAKNRALSRATV